jgi:hypothetical protein
LRYRSPSFQTKRRRSSSGLVSLLRVARFVWDAVSDAGRRPIKLGDRASWPTRVVIGVPVSSGSNHSDSHDFAAIINGRPEFGFSADGLGDRFDDGSESGIIARTVTPTSDNIACKEKVDVVDANDRNGGTR